MIISKRQQIQLHTFKFEDNRQTNMTGLNNKADESVMGQLTELSCPLKPMHLMFIGDVHDLCFGNCSCADVNRSPR